MSYTYVQKRAEDLGIPVVDSTKHVAVVVTDHDVVNAKKANSKHCALSRAAMRVPGINAAYFFLTTAYLEYDDKIVRFKLPSSVQKEIVSFDRAQKFASGLYVLTPVSQSLTRGTAKKNRRKKREAIRVERLQLTRALMADTPKLPLPKVSRRDDLRAAIERVAEREPKNPTPEQAAFDRQVAGIIGKHAPIPLKQKRPHHKTKYVRGTEEPE